MGLHHVDHINIEAVDLQETKRFYCDLLGLYEGERPPLPFPGMWLYCENDRPTVHVLGSQPGNAAREAVTSGRFHHVSFMSTGAEEIRSRLDASGIAYKVVVLPGVRMTQFIMKDPNGISVELTFPASETRQSDEDAMQNAKLEDFAV